jgi:hypothetical protein
MKKTQGIKSFIIGVIIIFLGITVVEPVITPSSITIIKKINNVRDIEEVGYIATPVNNDTSTEYWALLIAVGIYRENPWMNRRSMLTEVENLYTTLLRSTHWEEQHIRVITGENATFRNIQKGFKWLDQMEDENDICLVYITTHGFPILVDLPPFDEEDRIDEALATYKGFLPIEKPWSWEPIANPFGIITDDELNCFLNKMESKGLCFIIDSCHSGGFNDNWSFAPQDKTPDLKLGLARDVQTRNRVTMTSVPEENISFGSYFTQFIIEGMNGHSDYNDDGMCSAEEIFWYAESMMKLKRGETGMAPQIFDDYLGELILTEAKLP